MSAADDRATENGSGEGNGVLVNLPRARPQRASARRAASRNGSSRNGARRGGASKRPPKAVAKQSPPTKATGKVTAKAATKAAPKPARKRAAKTSGAATSKPLAKGTVKAVRESAASSTARASRAGAGAARPAARGATGTPRSTRGSKSRGNATQKRVREAAAPRQGFESEGETTAASVQPPGGVELVASAAELVGELAKAGVSTGERLLKDVLSRLPL